MNAFFIAKLKYICARKQDRCIRFLNNNHILTSYFNSNFMKNNSFFAVLTIFMLAFSACGKDDSPKDLLTSASCWKITKIESRASANDPWENTILIECTKDDCTSYDSDGKFTFDEGATKCVINDPQTITGTYTLSEDGKTLVMTDTQVGFPLTFTVEEITSGKLVLVSTFLGDTRTTYEAN